MKPRPACEPSAVFNLPEKERVRVDSGTFFIVLSISRYPVVFSSVKEQSVRYLRNIQNSYEGGESERAKEWLPIWSCA